MPDLPAPTSPGAVLDLRQSQGAYSRRARPPDPHTETAEAVRVPLKVEFGDKTRRRESRLGLRNIFGRGKGGSEGDRGAGLPREALSKAGGIRASLAEINWPYGLHQGQGHRSEVSLSSFSKPLPAGQGLKHKKSESIVRQQPDHEGIAAWSPPPLFQAYPQAIKHAHLPACTISAEVVLRMHHHKSSGSLVGMLSPSTPDIPEETTGERPKRRHRRNGSGSSSRFEWTTKVYILVTSGYLLQYAGEGSFDRLPESVLQLGKESAAFASDAIPGRHWVLQVSSVAEPDRAFASHSSLRARLPFRGTDKRHSSTFLMVYESAEEMDSWIAVLRREIEKLGGRKVLSETGKPKASVQDAQSRSQGSQRAFVVRDPDRFSRVIAPDWNQSLPIQHPDAPEDPALDQSFDDTSTASFISHEGRQLDALRDSMNRLSLHSSGQRTVVTSVGSSPACSPVRDTFGELDSMPEHPYLEEHPQPRLRPNAMAIIDRRQSLQAINHVLEMRVASAQSLRPLSMYSNSGQPEAAPSLVVVQQSMPNFSVPQNAGKRFSFTRSPPGVPPPQITTASPLPVRTSTRRPPPSALSINPRPLSLVEDQPSPAFSSLSRAGSATGGTGSPLSASPTTPPISSPPPQRVGDQATERQTREEALRDSGISTQDNTPGTDRALDPRPSSEPQDSASKVHKPLSPSNVASLDARNIPRSRTSLGTYGEFLPEAQAGITPVIRVRRSSFSSPQQVERTSRALSPPPSIRNDHGQRPRAPSLKLIPKSPQHLRLDLRSQAQSLVQRRSMSQLAEGPPPAPPPNRALPPIPQKSRVDVPPPGFI
ncbi:hypothetical protein N657DRAFT_291590 [Parathielavia appendiculata]|uniref:PH domain-containing protein n=1 Tax=Parathielavia appendiculata TaxID=2587402 RepID=A0AAN6Z676_9PEZI|nr:hypothetical protein N657DRAFT_291590 [Parathielavia appendiculata]